MFLFFNFKVPPQYGNTWKLNYKELIDTENFIKDYHPIKFTTDGNNSIVKFELCKKVCNCLIHLVRFVVVHLSTFFLHK